MPAGKPVIFLAFANDQQDQARYLRGLAQELRGIRNALGPARQAQAVEIVERANATVGDILDVFQDPAYSGRIRVFHYGGHADSYQLMLESGDGGAEVAHAAGFSQFLANQPGLEVVFLNGCSTQAQARDLRAAGIPAVIATSQVIDDDIARRFAIRFYKGLGGYATVSKSFTDATAEVLTLTGTQNYRSLYWGDEPEPPNAYPWEVYPDPPGDWRLNPGTVRGELQVDDIKIGKYAHVLCNRYQQNDEFVSSHVQAPAGRPRIYLIHGLRDEKHESLITRFSYEYIGLPKQYLRPVEIKNWPFKGDLETLMKVRLAEHFEGLNRGDKPIQQLTGLDIMRQTSLSGQEAIILQHNIPAEYWNKDTAPLIRWYVEDFWNVSVPRAEAPQFVIFLNVLYSDEVKEGNLVSRLFSKKYVKSKILGELQQLARAHPEQCILLSELEAVRRPHVEDWLIETNLAEVEELASLPDQIFLAGAKPLESEVMARIEPHLKGAIKLIQDKYAHARM